MSGWSCPDQIDERCARLGKPCDPGMPGCHLYGKVRFLNLEKNRPSKSRRQSPQPDELAPHNETT